MKNFTKFIFITCSIMAAILNANETNAQNPSITPSNYSVTMYQGQIHNTRFHANNAIIQNVVLMNQMDSEVPIEIDTQNTFFDITIRAIGAVLASRIITYILKAALIANPYAGLIIFTCDVIISIVAAYVIIAAPILHLPMLALITKRPSIMQEDIQNFSISKCKTFEPILAIA